MNFEISGPEAALLGDILGRHLGDLRVEIMRTEKLDDRRDLQRTEAMLKALIARLEKAAIPASS